ELEQENERLRQALTERSEALGELQRAHDEAVQERDSLRERNKQLFETTELANRQIGSLTDSLAELRANLKQHRDREQSLDREQAALRAELEALQREHAETRAAADRSNAELERAREAAAAADARAAELAARLAE